jgi:hypothetical protein
VGLNNINFAAIRSIPRPWDQNGWKRPVQAEILVPDRIPLEYISHIAFVSKASMSYSEKLCNLYRHPPFQVDRQLFADFSVSSKWTVDFPHVMELILTDTNIEENVVNLSYTQKNRFSMSGNCATLVTKIRAMSGTKAKVLLRSANTRDSAQVIDDTDEFAVSSEYYHWFPVPLEGLSYGFYIIEYYLGDICWASTEFEVVQ